MPDTSNAWMLDIGAGIKVAVAENEIVEYLRSPRVYQVPMTPRHCSSIVFWRGDRMLPLFDLAMLTQPGFEASADHLGVLAYQTAPKEPIRHLGIALQAPPQRIRVSDADACDWPEDYPESWKALTLALFAREDACIPVLDVPGLDSETRFRS